jgi:hypothetical protein
MLINLDQKDKTIRRSISIVLAAVFLVSAFMMTNAHAWASLFQSVLNETKSPHREPTSQVLLVKNEKTPCDIETTIPIEGAEFYLYKDDGELVSGPRFTDADGKIELALAPGKYYFE